MPNAFVPLLNSTKSGFATAFAALVALTLTAVKVCAAILIGRLVPVTLFKFISKALDVEVIELPEPSNKSIFNLPEVSVAKRRMFVPSLPATITTPRLAGVATASATTAASPAESNKLVLRLDPDSVIDEPEESVILTVLVPANETFKAPEVEEIAFPLPS